MFKKLIKIRILSLLSYLGFAPLLWLWGNNERRSKVLEHHINSGLILSAILIFSIIFCIVILLVEYFIEIRVPLELLVVQIIFTISGIPVLIWMILTMIGITQAIRGSTSSIPIVIKLSILKNFKVLLIPLGFLPLLILILIIRANYLVHSPNDPAAVYLLYETTDYIQLTKDKNLIYPVPEWGVATMFYTISETAINRWGPGSVSLEPLSKANLSKAFREGRLVIVSAHGSYEGISISEYTNEFYGPEDVGKHGGVGSNLQFVYFNGCNIGKREEAWKKSLGDVEPVVYDYIAFEQKHVLWYVFKGPIIVLNLK